MGLRERLSQAPDIGEEELRRLETLDALLVKWGRAIDLVGFRTEDERATRYFAEALASLSWVPERGKAPVGEARHSLWRSCGRACRGFSWSPKNGKRSFSRRRCGA